MKNGLLILTLFALCSLFPSSSAAGANWTFIEKSKDGNMSTFIDKESITQISEDIVKSCQKFSYTKPTLFNHQKRRVSAVIACREWDCDAAKYNNLQLTFYYLDGTKETETYEYALWHYVRNSSPERGLLEYVCTTD